MMLRIFVRNRGYLTEEELMELNALCVMLPGPASTQTVAAIAYTQGGTKLAVLSALIWLLPPAALMTAAALLISSLSPGIGFARLFRFIEPIDRKTFVSGKGGSVLVDLGGCCLFKNKNT